MNREKSYSKRLKDEIFNFDPARRLFVLAAMFSAFLISAEYGIIRPASNAIFITHFTAGFFPYAWLATVPLNLAIVYLYNRFLPKWGCWRTFLTSVAAVSLVNAICGLFVERYPLLSFFHFIWKDIYILLLFKQLWSLIHSTVDTGKAKYLYGFLFGMGGLGSVAGSLIPSFLAVKMGSPKLFFFTVPLYLALFFFYSLAYKNSQLKTDFRAALFPDAKEGKNGFSQVLNSRFLTYILLVVVFMQISIAFVDYQFNVFLEANISTRDLRTQYCGRMVSIINSLTTTFQFLGGFLLIHFLGLKNAHRSVPIFLLGNGLLFLLFPTFGMISYAYISIKAIDYSFFSVIREMLYIPLKTDEKFRAKAVIDVFGYRTAKALAAFILLSFQFFTSSKPVYLVGFCSLITFLAWSLIVLLMFRQYKTAQDTAI